MHIVSDYANVRAFVLLDPAPATGGVASLTATLFARARLHRKFRAMRRADLLAQNVSVFV